MALRGAGHDVVVKRASGERVRAGTEICARLSTSRRGVHPVVPRARVNEELLAGAHQADQVVTVLRRHPFHGPGRDDDVGPGGPGHGAGGGFDAGRQAVAGAGRVGGRCRQQGQDGRDQDCGDLSSQARRCCTYGHHEGSHQVAMTLGYDAPQGRSVRRSGNAVAIDGGEIGILVGRRRSRNEGRRHARPGSRLDPTAAGHFVRSFGSWTRQGRVEEKRADGRAAPSTRSAKIRPTVGTNLNPCPEKPAPTTIGPTRSRTKSVSSVDV